MGSKKQNIKIEESKQMVKASLVHYVALLWAATVLSVLLIASKTSERQRVMLGEFDAKYLLHLSKLEEAAFGQGKGPQILQKTSLLAAQTDLN